MNLLKLGTFVTLQKYFFLVENITNKGYYVTFGFKQCFIINWVVTH